MSTLGFKSEADTDFRPMDQALIANLCPLTYSSLDYSSNSSALVANKSASDLDRIDIQILRALQANGRLTMGELAEKVSLSQSPCWRRVQLLEQAGFIEGYRARLSRKALGLGVHGFVSVRVKDATLKTSAAFERAVVAMENAIACLNLSGGYDYQIELIATDQQSFANFVREIRGFPGVSEVYTSFTLHEIKSNGLLPVR